MFCSPLERMPFKLSDKHRQLRSGRDTEGKHIAGKQMEAEKGLVEVNYTHTISTTNKLAKWL